MLSGLITVKIFPYQKAHFLHTGSIIKTNSEPRRGRRYGMRWLVRVKGDACRMFSSSVHIFIWGSSLQGEHRWQARDSNVHVAGVVSHQRLPYTISADKCLLLTAVCMVTLMTHVHPGMYVTSPTCELLFNKLQWERPGVCISSVVLHNPGVSLLSVIIWDACEHVKTFWAFCFFLTSVGNLPADNFPTWRQVKGIK